MRAKKPFTGIRGVPSMKVRGGGDNELERLRIEKRTKPQPGDWSIAPTRAACDRRLGRASAVHLLLLLAKYRNAKTGECFVRMKRLACELGITRRMAQMHIAKLVKAEYLMVIPQRRQAGGYAANCYVLLYPKFKPVTSDNLRGDIEDERVVTVAKPRFA